MGHVGCDADPLTSFGMICLTMSSPDTCLYCTCIFCIEYNIQHSTKNSNKMLKLPRLILLVIPNP